MCFVGGVELKTLCPLTLFLATLLASFAAAVIVVNDVARPICAPPSLPIRNCKRAAPAAEFSRWDEEAALSSPQVVCAYAHGLEVQRSETIGCDVGDKTSEICIRDERRKFGGKIRTKSVP